MQNFSNKHLVDIFEKKENWFAFVRWFQNKCTIVLEKIVQDSLKNIKQSYYIL